MAESLASQSVTKGGQCPRTHKVKQWSLVGILSVFCQYLLTAQNYQPNYRILQVICVILNRNFSISRIWPQ